MRFYKDACLCSSEPRQMMPRGKTMRLHMKSGATTWRRNSFAFLSLTVLETLCLIRCVFTIFDKIKFVIFRRSWPLFERPSRKL